MKKVDWLLVLTVVGALYFATHFVVFLFRG